MNLFNKLTILALLFTICLSQDVFPCASFSFYAGDALIFGRNVDSPKENAKDGTTWWVVVNKRGVQKQSTTFNWLYGGKKDSTPKLSWESKYGSITFNYRGVEFPDGGMNEAGLFFEEMTLMKTKYSTDKSKPTFFMPLWIQYILDTCETVAQVVESANNVNIDGWNWHFYTADRFGDNAVIQFLNGKSVIHKGSTLPYPILTNSIYTQELDKIKAYQGFGGDKPLDVEDYNGPTRFIRGACMIKNYTPSKDISPVDYGFKILETISPAHIKKFQKHSVVTNMSKVYDVKKRRIFFRTDIAKKIRYVDMDAFDYTCKTPRKILNMDADLAGDVTLLFRDYTDEENVEILKKALKHASRHSEFVQYAKENNVTVESIVKRYTDYIKTVHCNEN